MTIPYFNVTDVVSKSVSSKSPPSLRRYLHYQTNPREFELTSIKYGDTRSRSQLQSTSHRIKSVKKSTNISNMKSNMAIILVLVTLCACLTDAIPLRRAKRVSDQRLAELETLLALAKMRTRYATLPVGMGMINPAKIGKRKRSVSLVIPMEESAVDTSDDADINEEVESEEVQTFSEATEGAEETTLSKQDLSNLLTLARLLRTKDFHSD